jgi:zinc transport system substrate-binding protein
MLKGGKKRNIAIISGFILLFFIVIFFYFQTFQKKTPAYNSKLKVTTTIFPLYDIAEQIGGDKIELVTLLPKGASPHTFEPTPEIIRQISQTNLFLFAGAGLDSWATFLVEDNIDRKKNNYRALDLSEKVVLKPYLNDHEGEDEEGAEEHEHADFDPHYWLSPANALLIAQGITEALSEEDRENESYYRANLEIFQKELELAIKSWQEKMEQLERKEIIVFHDAWNYFADFFDLNIVASFEPFPGKTPSPKYLQSVQNEIIAHDISVVFTEPQLAPDLALALAFDVLSQVAILDPLGGLSGRESYLSLIDYNVETIYSYLK